MTSVLCRYFAAFLALVTALGASGHAWAEVAATPPVAAVQATQASAGYRLGVADRIRLTVFNETTISGEFAVNPSGFLSLPLIGDVEASGKTVDEVKSAIQTKLADGYLRDPKVAIDILTFRPFYILGEVTKPGEYPCSDEMTVMNAVATAQGFTYRANKKYIFIKHSGDSAETRVPLTPELKVTPGDTIRIGERYF